MVVNFQPSLFDDGSRLTFAPIVPGEGRTLLANEAWIELIATGAGSDQLFEHLVEAVPWKAERRRMYERTLDVPRLVSFYGEGDTLPDVALETVSRTLSSYYQAELGESFRTVGLCLYRDGRDSVAWHGDRIGRSQTEDTMVAIVSLGARRRFLCDRAAVVGPESSSWGEVICWSWVEVASGPGNTRCLALIIHEAV